MSEIPRSLADLAIARAFNGCEYCPLSQIGQEATFHIDHVVPRAAGGPTAEENLALACVSCSLRKGAKRVAIDPQTGDEVPLFHPRSDNWDEHFRWDGECPILELAVDSGDPSWGNGPGPTSPVIRSVT